MHEKKESSHSIFDSHLIMEANIAADGMGKRKEKRERANRLTAK